MPELIIENPNPRGSEPRFTRKRLQEAELASVEMLLLLHTKGDDWDAGEGTCSGAWHGNRHGIGPGDCQ